MIALGQRGVRVTAESIPFRDGEIRLALVPFPRKRKDGSYKIAGGETTAYIVFPDNCTYPFNDIFNRNVVLPWPNGSEITLTEREEIDDAAWGIFKKYGLIVGEFLCNPWGGSGDAVSTSQPESESDYNEWIAEQHALSDASDTKESNLPLLTGSAVVSSPLTKAKTP